MKLQSTQGRLLAAGAISLTLAACGGDNTANPVTPANAQTPQTNTTSDALRPDRIPLVVGGSVVDHKRYPWMAALVSASDQNASSGQFCGGSLIAKNWVLTAAHCIENETAGSTDVLVGQLDLNENNGQRVSASRIIIHPGYESNGYPDLALVELKSPIQAPVISLPSRNNPAPNDGEIATVIGWGQISETGPYSDKLLETSLPIVDHNTCNRAYNNEIDQDSMVCAGTPSGDKDSCYGDSGGPLFVKRNDEYVQAGVVSFGEECGLAGVPGVYARVSSYYDWISGYAPVKAYDTNGNSNSGDNDNSTGNDTDNNTDTDADNGNNNNGDSDTTDPVDTTPDAPSDSSWTFNENVDGWFEEVYLPDDTGAISMDSGILLVELTTDSREPMIVFVDEYDPEYDEWYTLTGEITYDGELQMELDISAGEYGFSVLSLGDGGSFTLNATLEQE